MYFEDIQKLPPADKPRSHSKQVNVKKFKGQFLILSFNKLH